MSQSSLDGGGGGTFYGNRRWVWLMELEAFTVIEGGCG